MPVAPSFSDLLALGQAEAQTRRPDLLFADGDITIAFLHAAATMSDACVRFAAQAFKDTFLDGAEGDALTTLVDDHLNLQRQPATQAQATVQFSRPSAGGGEPAGTIAAGTTVATAFTPDGEEVQFTTDVGLAFGLGELGPKSVAVTAADTGRDGNVGANEIVRVIDAPGFDPTFNVDNSAVAAGGNEEESDEDLRERARSFFLTLRRGTLDSLEFGALTVATVRVARATEDTATGLVTLTVSDSDGNSTAQMRSDAEIAIEAFRCAGSNVTVAGGTQLTTDITVTIAQASPGFDVSAASADIEDAISGRMERLRPDETLFLDSLIAAIIAVDPDNIFDVTFTLPIADVVPGAGQVIRAGVITIS